VANEARVVLQTVEPHGERFAAHMDAGSVVAFDGHAGPEAASPVQILLAALGACAGIDVLSILRKKRKEVTGYEVVVQGERRQEHPRIFTRIEVVHRLRGRDLDPGAVEEAVRLSDTRYCTVHGMLGGTAEIVSRIEIEPV